VSNSRGSPQELLLRKISIVYKYLIKIGCSRDDAEDIIQDTLLKAVIYLEAIDLDKMGSWLFKVALNGYYDLCRKNKKIVPNFPEIENMVNDIETSSYIPEIHILNKEKKRKVSSVLNGLKPVYKNLLVLKYVVGLSYREIAEILGIREQTVKTYIYRARQKFKNNWRSNYE